MKKIKISFIISFVAIVLSIFILIIGLIGFFTYPNEVTKFFFGYSMNEKNPDTCKKIDRIPYKDGCYNLVAVNTKNISLCEKIKGNRQKEMCMKGASKDYK
jgi:hypothetical protein